MRKILIYAMLITLCASVGAKTADVLGVTDTISNEYVKIAIGQSGLFTIGTTDGKRLLYGFPSEGSTSHTYVRIDGVSYLYGSSGTITDSLHQEGNSLTMTWTYADIDITQRLTIVEGASTGNNDTALIEYFITNHSGASHEVGILLEMDTMINGNDAAPISTSFGYVAVEQDFLAPDIPQYWQAFEVSPTQAESLLIGQGTLSGGSAVMPDRFCLGPWGTYTGVQWDYTSTGDSYGDSAVLLWWNAILLVSGASRHVGTLYGLGAGSYAEGELAINTTAPLSLTLDSTGAYSPNPFEVNILVTNTITTSITGIVANITLPSGLHLASGDSVARHLSPVDLNPGQVGSVSWTVYADNRDNAADLTYTISVNGSGYTNDVQRTVHVPESGIMEIASLVLHLISISTNDFPIVKAYCTVKDTTQSLSTDRVRFLNASNFSLTEDGTIESIISAEYNEIYGGSASKTEDGNEPLDLVIAVDVSNYMTTYASYINTLIDFVVTRVEQSGYDYHYALVTFTDSIEALYDFTSSVDEVRGWGTTAMTPLSNSPSQTCALEAIARTYDFSWRADVRKQVLLVTAGPFASAGSYTTAGTVDEMKSRAITASILGVDNADQHWLADSTNGSWYPIEIVILLADSLLADSASSAMGEYVITYSTHNVATDGSLRNVDITCVVDSFADSDEKDYYAPSTSGLYLAPETTYTRRDLHFSVDVVTGGIINLYDFESIVNFDQNKIRLDSVKIGEFLARDANAPFADTTQGAGNVDIALTRNGSMSGVTGSGVLATLHFTAIADDPTSLLYYSSAVLRDSAMIDITTDIDTFAYVAYLTGTGSGEPGDSTDCLLCDFDCNGEINTRDFALLAQYWQPSNTALGNVGPATGLPPTIVPRGDRNNLVNFEDLFIFGRMWNWYHLTVLGHSRVLPVCGEVCMNNVNGEISVIGRDLPPVAMAHFVIKYDKMRTAIQNVELDALSAGFASADDGVIDIAAIRLANNGEQAEISENARFAHIEYSGENTFEILEADLRTGEGTEITLERIVRTTPRAFGLGNVTPNPFNPVAKFQISIPEKGKLSVDIYDFSGHKIATLANSEYECGTYEFKWNGTDYPAGIYFVKSRFGSETKVTRALLVK